MLMRVSGHELCPTLHAAFSDSGSDYLVQDFVRGRDMETVLGSGETRGEARILRWAVCLTRAVAHLHAQRIVHQDLKPANIRLNLQDDPVLLDFGAARDFTLPEDALAEYGTDGYMPPERATAGERGLTAGCLADVFALGAILVEAMIGQRLTQEEINAHKERLFGALIHSASLPSAFVHAVFKALAYDPAPALSLRAGDAGRPAGDRAVCWPGGSALPGLWPRGAGRPTAALRDGLQCRRWSPAGARRGRRGLAPNLEAGGHGAASLAFEGNRLQLVVTALPERVTRNGAPVEGEVRFVFPSGIVRVRCSIERPALPADVRATPAALQIRPGPLGRATAALTFHNRGELPAAVSLRASPPRAFGSSPMSSSWKARRRRLCGFSGTPTGVRLDSCGTGCRAAAVRPARARWNTSGVAAEWRAGRLHSAGDHHGRESGARGCRPPAPGRRRTWPRQPRIGRRRMNGDGETPGWGDGATGDPFSLSRPPALSISLTVSRPAVLPGVAETEPLYVLVRVRCADLGSALPVSPCSRPPVHLVLLLDASGGMHRIVLEGHERDHWQQVGEGRGDLKRGRVDGREGWLWSGQTLSELQARHRTPM